MNTTENTCGLAGRYDRLTVLPAFIEEALSNVSLRRVIAAYLAKDARGLAEAFDEAMETYAEEWVHDEIQRRDLGILYGREAERVAIDRGERLFSKPACAAGLPEPSK